MLIDPSGEINPEDFDNPFDFMKAMISTLSPENIESNITFLAGLWGAKTGQNPRVLYANLIGEHTAPDEVWEKVCLPRLRSHDFLGEMVPLTATEPTMTKEEGDRWARSMGLIPEPDDPPRHFTVGTDGETEEQ